MMTSPLEATGHKRGGKGPSHQDLMPRLAQETTGRRMGSKGGDRGTRKYLGHLLSRHWLTSHSGQLWRWGLARTCPKTPTRKRIRDVKGHEPLSPEGRVVAG